MLSFKVNQHYLTLQLENESQAHRIDLLKEALVKEKANRSKSEEELSVSKYHKNQEAIKKQGKELNQIQLRMERDMAQQSNTELLLKNQNLIRNIETLKATRKLQEETYQRYTNQIQQLKAQLSTQNEKLAEISTIIETTQQTNIQLEQKIETKEQQMENQLSVIKTLESEKDGLIETLSSLDKECINLQQQMLNIVDDQVLYHWMVIAIRLDYLLNHKSNNSTIQLNFDRESTYEYLKLNKVPYTLWPKHILTQILNKPI